MRERHDTLAGLTPAGGRVQAPSASKTATTSANPRPMQAALGRALAFTANNDR